MAKNDEDEKEYDFDEVEKIHGVYSVIGAPNNPEFSEYVVSVKADDSGWPFCFCVRIDKNHHKPVDFSYISFGSPHLHSGFKYKRHTNLQPTFVLALIPETD